MTIVVVVGGTIDFTIVFASKQKLQQSADSSVLSVLGTKSYIYQAAARMASDGQVSGADTAIDGAFRAELIGFPFQPTSAAMAGSASKQGNTITADAVFSADVKTYFLQIIGIPKVSVAGTSQAKVDLPKFVDFYIAVDVSGSMDLPSTAAEQQRLANINPDYKWAFPTGCMFACHFSGFSGFALSRNGGVSGNSPVDYCPTTGSSSCIQLRTDAVTGAILELINTASSVQTVSNQYQIGLYPFINSLTSYFSLSPNYTGAKTTAGTLAYAAVKLSNLTDTGDNSYMGAGGTNFTQSLQQMNAKISSIGGGTSTADRSKTVMIITDGLMDTQYYWGGIWYYPPRIISAFNSNDCSAMKLRGITVSVIYVPFLPLPVNGTGFDGENSATNAQIPSIPTQLKTCASTNYFFTADSPQAITSAMKKIFYQATAKPAITH